MKETYVPDISTIVNGRVTQLIEDGDLKGSRILIPVIISVELETRAELGRDSGFSGLDELKKLRKFENEKVIEVSFVGERPSEVIPSEIRSETRKVTKDNEATLITSDEVMAEAAEIEGLKVRYLKPLHEDLTPELFKFFEPEAMSVHLKTGVRPLAKVGRPGNFKIKVLDENPLSEARMRDITREITELARRDPDGYIEIEKKGASIIQLREYRIAVSRPPFSDAMEVTAVRPIVDVSLDDYSLPDKLKERLNEQAEGVLVAGPPGAGKSTFAQALAEFYRGQDKVVKTMESPRDLQVSEEVTQYTALEGDMGLTSDFLLMVRPDYTIYDELRKSDDFEIFVDMRFAGVGMVGVVHSTKAIDAIQRLIGRVELGMIPMVVDTVIFVKGGRVEDVFALKPTVGVPHGMGSPDLARPMVEVQDFETGKPNYQIYSFGEQVVVMPVKKRELSPEEKEKAQTVKEVVKSRTGANVDVEMLSGRSVIVKADPKDVPRIIGKKGRTVDELQDILGVRIDVQEKEWEPPSGFLEPEVEDLGNQVLVRFDDKYSGEDVKLYAGDSLLFKGSIGSGGEIKIRKDTQIGEQVEKIRKHGIPIKAEIV